MSGASCANSGPPIYLSYFTSTVSLCLALFTIPGNFLICYAIYRDPFHELRTPFNYLILSLALTDLLVGVLMDPVSFAFHLTEGLRTKVIDIQLLHMLYFILSTASILTLAALTFDRYIAVLHPLKYKNELTCRRSIIVSCLIWVVSLAVSSVYFELKYILYSLIFTNTAVVVTFIVLVLVYASIYKRLHCQAKQLSQRGRSSDTETRRANRRQLHATKCEAKVTKALVYVLLAYIICFLPVCIIIYVLNFCTICSCEMIEWLRDLQFVIVLLNSAINPYLYAWRMPQYKKVLYKYLPFFRRSRLVVSCEVPSTSLKPVVDHNAANKTASSWCKLSDLKPAHAAN